MARLAEAALTRPPAEFLDLLHHSPLPAGAVFEGLRNHAARHYGSDAAEAWRIAKAATDLADQTNDPLARGWARRAMAEASLFSGRMSDAEAEYAKAAREWKRAGAEALLGQLLVGRIHVLALLGRMKEVETTARQARCLLEAAGDQVYLAKLAMNLGNLHFQRDEYAAALQEYDRARAIFRARRIRDQAVIGLEVNRAVALTQLDRDTEALDLFQDLDRDCKRRKLDLLQSQARMNAAYVHFLRGDFDQALKDLGSATEYFRRTDHPAFLASCLLNRAEIYHQLNLHEDALALADQAAGLFGAADLSYDRGLALTQGAFSRLSLGEAAAALPGIREAGRIFLRERSPARAALARLLGAEASGRRGRRAEGRRKAGQAMNTFRDLGLVRWEAISAVLWEQLQASSAKPGPRLEILGRILARLPEGIYPVQRQTLLELLGAIQEEAGDSAAAAETLERAVDLLERVRVRVPTEDSKVAFLRDRTSAFDRLISLEVSRPAPDHGRLHLWMERSRAQALWDRMRDPGRWSGGSGAVLEPMRRRLSWIHARLSRLELGTEEERRRAGPLRMALLKTERDWTLQSRLRSEGSVKVGSGKRASRSRHQLPQLPRQEEAHHLEAIQRALPRGCGFLAYHMAPGCSLALWASKSRTGWIRMDDRCFDRLVELTSRLDFQWSAAAAACARARIGDGSECRQPVPQPPALPTLLRTSAERILTEMHDLVWNPLSDAGLPAGLDWIISPHGPSHRIPFSALIGPGGPLVTGSTIRIVPSARIWLELQRRRRPRVRRAYVAGIPSQNLPHVSRETTLIRNRLRDWEVHLDLAPTRERLRQEAQRSELVHLAAHGSLRRDNPAFSYLELADGPLFVHDLVRFRLPGSLVVLSACSSGRGASPAGDEWIGLARGFLQAGASSVVASLWPIDDAATAALMDRFYERVALGQETATALRGAMEALRSAGSDHPWQWASFATLGRISRTQY